MPVNDTTTNRSYQKPNIANTLSDDVGRLRSALDAIDTDMASKAPSAGPTFTGVTTIAAGTAAAPSLTFTGATSYTGLYSPGADQVAISTGGTGRVFVDASGNVGIKGAPTLAAFSLEAAANQAIGIKGISSNAGFIGTYDQYLVLGINRNPVNGGVVDSGKAASEIGLYANNGNSFITFSTTTVNNLAPTERLRITSDGNVGIGTSSPGRTFQVVDATNAVISAKNGTIEGVLNATTTGVNVGSASNDFLTISTNSIERLRITSDGKVGVGTSTPDASLTVNGVGAFGAGSATTPSIAFTGDLNTGIYSPGADQVAISTNGAERLRVDSNGDLLSGTTGNLGYGGRNIILKSGQGYAGIASLTTESRFFSTWDSSAIPMTFFQGGSERMRLDSSGRLLVGTSTSTSTYGVSSAVQVFGTTYDTSSISLLRQTDTAIDSAGIFIARQRASGTKVLSSGDRVGYISFVGHNGGDLNAGSVAEIHAYADGEFTTTGDTTDTPGRLSFWTTADGAASPTEAMRINNQRELLIGTTTRTANGGVLQISNGITFPGTQSACSDPNTLDDYEEGTWTPAVEGSTTAGTATYAARNGKYTKTGNVVQFSAYILQWSSGTGTGNLRITGLPFTPSTGNTFPAVSLHCSDLALTANNVATGYVNNSVARIDLYQYPVGGGAATTIPYDTAVTELFIAGFYQTA